MGSCISVNASVRCLQIHTLVLTAYNAIIGIRFDSFAGFVDGWVQLEELFQRDFIRDGHLGAGILNVDSGVSL